MSNRAEYVSGLRKLADLLETHDEVPLPYQGRGEGMAMMFHFLDHRVDNRAAMAAAAMAFPCKLEKSARGEEYFDLTGQLDGLKVMLTAYRQDVCIRNVVGTEQIEVEERQGPDTRPSVTTTVTRDIVEWTCPPLLAGQVNV